jgi:hypothetical protein
MPGSKRFEKLHVAFQSPQQVVVSAKLLVFANGCNEYDT